MKTSIFLSLVLVSTSALASSTTATRTQNAIRNVQLSVLNRAVVLENLTCAQAQSAISSDIVKITMSQRSLEDVKKAFEAHRAEFTPEQIAEIEKAYNETKTVLDEAIKTQSRVYDGFILVCGLSKDNCSERLKADKKNQEIIASEVYDLSAEYAATEDAATKQAIVDKINAKGEKVEADMQAVQAACVDANKVVKADN